MAQVGISIGVGLALQLVGAALTPPRTVGKLENKKLPESSYGSRFSQGYGTFLVRAILIAAPQTFTEQKQKRGKIGGKTIEYTYSATLAYALCRGQTNTIAQLKLNGNNVVDFLTGNEQTLATSTEFYDDLVFRNGSDTQSPTAALSSVQSPNIPYRGFAHIVLPNFDLTEKYGNRPPLVESLVSTNGVLNSNTALVLQHSPFFLEHTIDPPPTTGPTTISEIDPDSHYTTVAGIAREDAGLREYLSGTLTASKNEYIEIVIPEDQNPQFILVANPNLTVALIGGNIEIYRDPSEKFIAPYPAGGNSIRFQWVSPTVVQILLNGVQLNTDYELGTDSVELVATVGADAYFIGADKVQRNIKSVDISNVQLADILQDICDEAGVNCDTTEIDDEILGVELRGDSPKEKIEQLQEIFGFFSVDSGNEIKFLNGIRPPAVRTFSTLEEFGKVDERPYTWDQKQLSELPHEIEVTHYDILEGDEVNQYWRRDSQEPGDRPVTSNKLQINTGATMTATAAIGIAEMAAARIWQEREQFNLTTTIANGDLEPGDTIILPYLGEAQEFLLTSVSYGANWLIEFDAVRYHRSPWQRKKTPTFTPAIRVSPNPYPSRLILAEIPRISSAHPTSPIYWAASQSDPGWQVCQLLASPDDGQTFSQVSETGIGGRVGVSLSTLLIGENTFRVRVHGELNTITQATFNGNNQANWLLVGNEIIKFRVATLIANIGQFSYYTLTDLQRGRKGTTEADHPHYSQVGLIADMAVFDRDLIGASGEVVQFKLFFDSIESGKEPYEYTLA